jgi:hypothetical protein
MHMSKKLKQTQGEEEEAPFLSFLFFLVLVFNLEPHT